VSVGEAQVRNKLGIQRVHAPVDEIDTYIPSAREIGNGEQFCFLHVT
jgi:hypothetical protein